MAIKLYNPTTPGRRGMTSQDFSEITISKPVKSLITIKKKHSGRNNQGSITVRHRGGGEKRYYRHVNFRISDGFKATVEHIEYDPNRSARIARVKDQNDKLHYVIAGLGWTQGQEIMAGKGIEVENGNRLFLSDIPVGTTISNIELSPNRGAQMCRAAGASAQLVAKEDKYATVKLPSGEMRKILLTCMATIGQVGNINNQNVKIGSAGRKRHMGWRPTVRGVVMNPVDHPHGKGDGGRHGTGRPPVTPWGVPTLGYKTRHNKKTDRMIVRSRHQAKRKKG